MKKTYLLIVVLMYAAQLCTAQPTARKFTLQNSADGESQLFAYLPTAPTGRAVVCCPGGGYSHLAIDHEGHDWAEYFNSQGIAFFVLKYRMPKGDRNIPMGDAYHAIETVRDSATAWQVNPYDVGIMGFSAGGHLASTVSTHAPFKARPNFSILVYPVISMVERESHRGSVAGFLGDDKKNERLVKDFTNSNAVRRHLTPPAILLLANDDRVVPPATNAIAYYTAMRRAGNDCAMHIYPSGGHGFGFRTNYAYHEQMLSELTAWLCQLPSPRPEAVRVACIGNSITDGSGIDMADSHGYPAQLQRLLGTGYHVRNFGVGARTLLNQGDHPYMKELAWRDAQAFQPDIVVIKLGTNDSKDYQWNQQQYEQDYQAMIDTLKALPSKPAIYLCTPIRAFKDKWGITDSVIVNGVIPSIQKVARRNHLTVIDLHGVITEKKDMTGDSIHPNDKGAGLIAKAVADMLNPKK